MAVLVVLASVTTTVAHPRQAAAFDPTGNYEPGYWHGPSDNGVDRSGWMADLPDHLKLGELTLPGTHASGTWQADGLISKPGLVPSDVPSGATTQLMSIETQLAVGIRALDIRIGNIENDACDDPSELRIVHGESACYPDTLHDVLSDVTGFLERHPSESVIMRIKRDTGDNDSLEESNRFDADVRQALSSPAYADRMFTPERYPDRAGCGLEPIPHISDAEGYDLYNQDCIEMNPTLESMRGKIVILQDWHPHSYRSANHRVYDAPWFAIPFGDRLAKVGKTSKHMLGWSIQNDWDRPVAELGLKFQLAHRQFIESNNLGSEGRSVNFLSAASPLGLPFQLAGGKSSIDPNTNAPQQPTGITASDCRYPTCYPVDRLGASSGGGFYEHAGSMYFKGINQLALEHIGYYKSWNRLGIVFADFPGPGDPTSNDDWTRMGLIGALIDVNFRPKPEAPQVELDVAPWVAVGEPVTVTVTVKNPNDEFPLQNVSIEPPSDTTGTVKAKFVSAVTPGHFPFGEAPNCDVGKNGSGYQLGTGLSHDASGDPTIQWLPASGTLNRPCRVTYELEPIDQPGRYTLTTSASGRTEGGEELESDTVSKTFEVGGRAPQHLTFNVSTQYTELGSDTPFAPPGMAFDSFWPDVSIPNTVVGGTLKNFVTGGSSGNPVEVTVGAGTTNGACEMVTPPPGTRRGKAIKSTLFSAILMNVHVYEVKMIRPGRCVLIANQAGSGTHLPATQIEQSFEVTDRAPQSIRFLEEPPSQGVIDDAALVKAVAVNAAGRVTWNEVVFSVNAEKTVNDACTITQEEFGSTLTLHREGLCVIDAHVAETEYYFGAHESRAIEVVRGPNSTIEQLLAWSIPGGGAVEVGSKFIVEVAGGGSGNAVSVFEQSDEDVCQITDQREGGVAHTIVEVEALHAGRCTLGAFQEGDDTHRPGYGQFEIPIHRAPQEIVFGPAPSPAEVDTSHVVSASGGLSGNPVLFTVDSSTTNEACSLGGDGITLSLDHAGTCVITASQEGNADYLPAPEVQLSFVVEAPVLEPPVAVIDAKPVSGEGPLTVILDGSGSTDPDGTIVSYEWDLGDGSGPVFGEQVSHTYVDPGSYAVTLKVTDNDAFTSTQSVLIRVLAPPVAVIDANPVSGEGPLTVTLDGSGSTDPDGTIVSYEWDLGDGSDPVFGDEVSHTYVDPGDYAVTLTVTDDDGLTATATVKVRVLAPPVAVIDANPVSGEGPLTVTLDGSGSTDPGGTIVSYEWDLGDGSGPVSGEQVSHTYVDPGSYAVTLEVTDDDGFTSTQSVLIRVLAPPVAVIDVTKTGTGVWEVYLDGSGSFDPDGTIASYEWNVAGYSHFTSSIGFVTGVPGEYAVTLKVTDDDGLTSTATVLIVLETPVAMIDANPVSGEGPLTVTLDGSGSTEADGAIVSYEWDLGDGSDPVFGEEVIHTYVDPGTYTVTLTVTDDHGFTSTQTMQIRVLVPPVAVIEADTTSGKAPLQMRLIGFDSFDPDGEIVSYEWDLGVGSAPRFGGVVLPVYLHPGEYWVTLTVTDNDGLTSTDTVLITVT